MTRCFSFIAIRNHFFRTTFSNSGLKPTTTNLGDGTIIHCWAPKSPQQSKPNLLLIHGFGANAMWQWSDLVGHMTPHFNVYVPDLLFFGESYTTRPERSDWFQAQCLIRLMEAHSVKERLSIVGLSYGGFVAYNMAAQLNKEVVDRLVICCAAVCLETKDIEDGKFKVSDLEAAADILLPQTPQKLRELVNLTMFKPPKILPNCFLNDFIQAMCTEHCQERRELIRAIPKDRKISEIPKISQPTLIIWGDQDQVFPVEFGHRLKNYQLITNCSHLGESAQLVVMKKAGHGFNVERQKEFYRHLKTFLIDSSASKQNNSHSNGG
ncbi:Lipase 3 [Bienertia sinuspersici]